MKKTLIKLCKTEAMDGSKLESTLRSVKQFEMDGAFPVNTVFVADGVTYTYTGVFQEVDDKDIDGIMVYVEEHAIDVSDKVVDSPHTGIKFDVRSGEYSKVN